MTSYSGPTVHSAALTAHGGALTAAFITPIWTRVMGHSLRDDGGGLHSSTFGLN